MGLYKLHRYLHHHPSRAAFCDFLLALSLSFSAFRMASFNSFFSRSFFLSASPRPINNPNASSAVMLTVVDTGSALKDLASKPTCSSDNLFPILVASCKSFEI